MSTKTTFKRIALVAVAALGLGVLSVAPSSADVSGVTVTVTNGTATTMNSDSTTGAKIKVSFLALAGSSDSITVAVAAAAAAPTGATVSAPTLMFSESTTSAAGVYAKVDTTTINAAFASASQAQVGAVYPSSRGAHIHAGSTANGTYSATLKFTLGETSTGTLVAGTYSYNAIVTSQGTSANAAPVVQVVPFSIVVSAVEAASTVASAAYTDAFIGSGAGTASADAAGITALATAGSGTAATITVNLRNASNLAVASDTVTVSVSGPGLVANSGSTGKSITGYLTGSQNFVVTPDGNAGLTTITVTTAKSGLNVTKSLSFYAKTAKTITAAAYNPVLATGANASAIAVTAVDSNGSPWTGTLYVVAASAADALIVGAADPVQCAAYNTTTGILCPITALTVGTAKVKVIDSGDLAVAAATATSNEVSVTVKAGIASSVKLSFDKATYAPNEKAMITVTPLDAAGTTLQGKVFNNLLATGGITSTSAFATGSMDSLTAVSYTTSGATSSTKTAGSYTFVVYMPAASGDVTISATGGTDLPAAAQVKVSATATVVNASVDAATDAANEATDAANAATDAALAAADAADAATAAAQDASDAVAALSASVSKLISSLRAQITSLTNLVIKIQKKVKA